MQAYARANTARKLTIWFEGRLHPYGYTTAREDMHMRRKQRTNKNGKQKDINSPSRIFVVVVVILSKKTLIAAVLS